MAYLLNLSLLIGCIILLLITICAILIFACSGSIALIFGSLVIGIWGICAAIGFGVADLMAGGSLGGFAGTAGIVSAIEAGIGGFWAYISQMPWSAITGYISRARIELVKILP